MLLRPPTSTPSYTLFPATTLFRSTPLGQARPQRDGGGTAADDHHLLASDLEVLGPVLGVHEIAPEPIGTGEVGLVAVVVAVVPAAGEQEPAGEQQGLAGVSANGGHVPACVSGGPLGADDAVLEADVGVDPLLGGRVLDVVPDGLARSEEHTSELQSLIRI